MKNHRAILEDQLEEYSEKFAGLNSYIKELNSTMAKLGTDRAQVEEDLVEAEHNAKYYHAEIGRLQKELGGSPSTKPGSVVPMGTTTKPGLLALALSPIGFLVGALLGAKLRARRDTKDN